VTGDFSSRENSPHRRFQERASKCCFVRARREWLVANLHDTKAGARLGREGELDLSRLSPRRKKEEAKHGGHRALVAKLKDALGDRVKDVRVSTRLIASPRACCDEHDIGGNLSRILKASDKTDRRRSRSWKSIPGASDVERLNEEKARFPTGNLLFDQRSSPRAASSRPGRVRGA